MPDRVYNLPNEKEGVVSMHGKKNIGAVTSLYPTPLVLCGTYDAAGKPNLVTVAWAGICCGRPPAIQISLMKQRYSHAAIVEKRAFTVNLPSELYAEQADYCGLVSGRDVDKFTEAKLTPIRGQFVDAPLVAEFPICMECRLLHQLEVGSHDLFVGEIVASWASEEFLEPDGGVNPTKVNPMAFAPIDGGYYTLGYSIGRAFHIGKSMMGER